MVRVAINGFGRIGRHVLHAGLFNKNIEWVAINDLADAKTLAYLFKHDSVFGNFDGSVDSKDNLLIINGKKILVLNEKDPSNLPWKKLKVDIVVESSGTLTSRETASVHLSSGARKVLVSCPCEGADITLVKGVNEEQYNKKKHHILSNASCTTNALAPIVKIINDSLGIVHGFMITAHALTADQRLIDAPNKDLRRGRSATLSIVPTTTGAAKAVAEVIPALKDKLDGSSWRVPVADGSIVNLSCVVKKSTSVNEINDLLRKASRNVLKGILDVSDEALVSHDIIGNSHSCIVDALSTRVVDNRFISIAAWYDNEWGYACRIVDLLKII
ncbi:MAG: type I glyceraldehyde-3-phosphate dehydrogenase [Candidatus Woesearchaeota archaeon]|nr:type I glyceraldehyde-3-phosphate dehydrogenase [Candidatus Woesearchaeota archaeon]